MPACGYKKIFLKNLAANSKKRESFFEPGT